MPNIILTSYCNLHCPYCFANNMIQNEKEKNITINQFTNILNWLNNSNDFHDRIGLIGGEPTLHPQINEILNITNNFCEQQQIPSILFTNGILLNNIINYISNTMKILININTPKIMSIAQFNMLNNNLDKIATLNWFENKVTLGCNICQQIDNYDFFWNIVKRYSIKRVRISIVAPTNQNLIHNKEKYYYSLKDKFLNFVNIALEQNIILGLDCNYIPNCYFSINELNQIKNIVEKKSPLCKPVIDITPSFKATACFGTYDLIDCQSFPNYMSLYDYLLYKKIVPLTINNIKGKCLNCKQHDLLLCQGGCLAFSNN